MRYMIQDLIKLLIDEINKDWYVEKERLIELAEKCEKLKR